jgi:cbb3-type cytochrome c oxidase subunit III
MAKKDNNLLDHDYDGIQELDNDLPPWWLWLFYITIGIAIVYMLYYHVFHIGDLQTAEYYKEMNPNWVPPDEQGPKHAGLFYESPYARMKKDITPRMIKEEMIAEKKQAEQKAREEEALAKAEGHKGSVALSDIGFDELIKQAMKKASPGDLEKLQTAFPEIYASYSGDAGSETATAQEIAVPEIAALTDAASLEAGAAIFQKNCASCHGKEGQGGIGPNMTDDYWLRGAGMSNIVHTIKVGVPAKGMISWQPVLKEQEILEVASYILTLHGTNPPNPKKPQGEKVDYPL